MNTKAVLAAVLVFAASLGTVTIASATPFDAKAFTATHPEVKDLAPCALDSHGRPSIAGVSFWPDKNPVGGYATTAADAHGNTYGFNSAVLIAIVSDRQGEAKCLLPDGFEAVATTSGGYVRP